MATNHSESFALNIILGRRLEKSSERFVKNISDLIEKKSVTTLSIIYSEPEFWTD